MKNNSSTSVSLGSVMVDMEKKEEQCLALLKRIAKIPSQTFSEEKKARFIQEYLKQHSIRSQIDKKGTVYGRMLSTNKKVKKILVVAHIDTVFPCTGDIKESSSRLFGHGVCDNSAGVTSLLIVLREIQKYQGTFLSHLYFAFTVQEEGLGGKGGMRHILTQLPRINMVINLESHNVGRITNQCVGQYRVKIIVSAPSAGHAFREFGLPNAIAILAEFISQWSRMRGFKKNDTTYNFGKISGGAGINSIAQSAEVLMEIRSRDQKKLKELIKKFDSMLAKIQKLYRTVKITTTVLSEAKAVKYPEDHSLYAAVRAVQKSLGIEGKFDAGNTDGDVPLGLNIPTVTLGTSIGYKTHSMDEYMEKKSLLLGIKQNFCVLYNMVTKVN